MINPSATDPSGELSRTALALLDIDAASPRLRAALIEQFHANNQRLYAHLGRSIAKRYGVPLDRADDLAQEVALVAISMVNDLDPAEVNNWEGFLTVQSRSRIRAMVQSGAWTGVSGLTTRKRKRIKLNETRDSLRHLLEREPSDTEVVNTWNAIAVERLTDAARQGMIATIEDLTTAVLLNVDDHGDSAVLDQRDGCLLDSSESPGFIAAVIERCLLDSVNLGAVAHVWLGPTIASPPYTPTAKEVAATLGREYEPVRRAVTQVRLVAVAVLSERLGIDRDDYLAS